MKKLIPMFLLTLFAVTSAQAQVVDIFHYQAEQNYFLLTANPYTIMLSRFEVERPARLHEINAWFHTEQSASDSVMIYLFGREGGGEYPLLLAPVVTIKAFVPVGSTLLRFPFQGNLPTFNRPTSFFVGVQPLGPNVKVRMDAITQTPSCATAEGDTMYTSSYWQPLSPPYIPYNARFGTGMAINNWYVGVKVEFDAPPQNLFTEATVVAKLHTMMPDGRRVSWGDFDNDGHQDLLYGQYLMRNNGNGTFTDISANSGYDGGSEVNMFVDIDNDGDLDIVCQPAELIYTNDGGMLTKDTQPGFGPGRNTTAMAFADYDGDFFPDMFVAHGEYMYMKNPANPQDSALVRGAAWEGYFYGNSQNGKFRDIKLSVLGGYRSGGFGRNPYDQQQTVNGYRPITGVNWADIDGDGDMDLYCTNNRLQPNYLFENQGNGFLRDVANLHGLQGVMKTEPTYIGLYGNSRGCDVADYDNDGDVDILVGESMEKFRLGAGDRTAVWKNSGPPNAAFTQVGNDVSKFAFDLYNGDVAWGDFDNDGLYDVFITPGARCFNAYLYKQNADGSFTNMTYEAGIDAVNSLGAVWVDYDNDGDLDLSVATETGLKLYRNDMMGMGNWVALNVRSKTKNILSVGAKVEVVSGANTWTRWITVGKGAGSQNPYTQYVGIGAAAGIDSVVVTWPDGATMSMLNPGINMIHDMIEADPVSVGDIAAAAGLELSQNYPNPFSVGAHATTSITYSVATAGEVRLQIYDARGALLRTLVRSHQDAGDHVVSWNGRDDAGLPVASGTYRSVLTLGDRSVSRNMIVVK
ncbi:MAG: VCBS repeat-containing protein [Bacteroidetes bacterium]|nr:VCBS repeat-containing protein [Bacteroidota bacterium]